MDTMVGVRLAERVNSTGSNGNGNLNRHRTITRTRTMNNQMPTGNKSKNTVRNKYVGDRKRKEAREGRGFRGGPKMSRDEFFFCFEEGQR